MQGDAAVADMPLVDLAGGQEDPLQAEAEIATAAVRAEQEQEA